MVNSPWGAAVSRHTVVSSPSHHGPEAPEAYDTIHLVNVGRLAPRGDEMDVLDVRRNQCAASTTLR